MSFKSEDQLNRNMVTKIVTHEMGIMYFNNTLFPWCNVLYESWKSICQISTRYFIICDIHNVSNKYIIVHLSCGPVSTVYGTFSETVEYNKMYLIKVFQPRRKIALYHWTWH